MVRITDPAISVVAGRLDVLELRDAERDGPVVALLDEEEQREQELVPGDHEHEQARRGDRRHGQRAASPGG
jgi:hypothetical protein